jgi:hypothetical protein
MPVPTSAIRFLAAAFATRPEPAAAMVVTPMPALVAWSMKSLRVISFFIFTSPENVEHFFDSLACWSDTFCANDRASAIAVDAVGIHKWAAMTPRLDSRRNRSRRSVSAT